MFKLKRQQPDTLAFTQDCRNALAQAREQAAALGHGYVGTEHILLALASPPNGKSILLAVGLDPREVRGRVGALLTPGSVRGRSAERHSSELPYTSRAKRVLELSMRLAGDWSTATVDTEHLLGGLLEEGKGIGACVLDEFGLTLARIRDATGAFRVTIDDASERSIYDQIIAQVQEAVATARLRPGNRLPPVRRMADDLDVAPGTVARAYAELESLGVVITDGARGTRIAEPRHEPIAASRRPEILVGQLRPIVVTAFHLGATATELRDALSTAMEGIYN